jgi:HD-like signal output (HDOD) protein
MRSANDIISAGVNLVTLPGIYMQVKRIIDDPVTSPNDLTKALSTDPGMTVRVLRLVNSAFWGFGGRIESVSRAVTLLGMLHVHDVVLATSVAVAFKGIAPVRMDVPRFWRHSVFRALAANALARKAELADKERVFIEGLLSDIGHMILFQRVPDLAAQALERAYDLPVELPRLERELIGCDYAEVGAALVAAWGLAPCFPTVIAHQHHPEEAGEHAFEAALVQIAGLLALQEFGAGPAAKNVQIPVSAWQLTGLEESCISQVLDETRSGLSAVIAMFEFATAANDACITQRPPARARA